MSTLLVVNADDLGLAEPIDEGIRRAATEGIVRSVSVLTTGRTFIDAARWLRERADLGVGVHLALCGGLPPASDRARVPTLLEGGRLRRSWAGVARALLTGRLRLDEVERELDAQVGRAIDAGLAIDHVDGHQHLHVLPGVIERVVRVCERRGIGALRLPVEPPDRRAALPGQARQALLSALSRHARGRLPRWLRAPDACHGLARSGRIDLAWLRALFARIGAVGGAHELMCHPGAHAPLVPEDPGWRSGWEKELRALTHPGLRAELAASGVEVVRFSDLARSRHEPRSRHQRRWQG